MKIALVCLVSSLIAIGARSQQDEEESSCTQIDFDEATVTSLKKCEYMQEFIGKRYDESAHFNPFRPGTLHYLSNRWQGLTCGETVRTYSFNADTELRMAYNLVFDSGATLEVRVFDLDRETADNQPILVEVWQTTVSTEGWGFFREKLNKTVKKARIQIEANMNAGSDLAIEYLTIFNYEVETDECSDIDEFQTTTANPTTTTHLPTTTASPTTTTTLPTTTETTVETSPATTTAVSTELSTVDEITPATTEVSEPLPTTTSEATTTPIVTTTTTASSTSTTTTETVVVTTTTNAPRDDTSMIPSSTTEQPTTTTSVQSTDSSSLGPTSITPSTPAPSLPPAGVLVVASSEWIWMTLTALFATLFLLATCVILYLWFANQHLDRVMMDLLEELHHPKQYKH